MTTVTLLATAKKHAWLIALFLLSLGALLYLTLRQPPTQTLPIQPNIKSQYQKLTVGTSTHQTIISTLGTPSSVYQKGEFQVYTYPSQTSYYSPDLLYVKDDILLLQELHYTPAQYQYQLNLVHQAYGQPEIILYGDYSPALQTTVHAYPSQGFAAFFDQQTNLVYQTQTFAPLTLDTYLSLWGKPLHQTQPTPPPAAVHR